jgi:hypothetical protein
MKQFILKDNELTAVASNIDINQYAKEIGGIVIDETHKFIINQAKLADIDIQLDELAKDLAHNETYKYDADYQATKDDILIKMQNLRDDRRALTND